MPAIDRIFVRIEEGERTVERLRRAGAQVSVRGRWAEVDRIHSTREKRWIKEEAAAHELADDFSVAYWLIHTAVDHIELRFYSRRFGNRSFFYDGDRTKRWDSTGTPTAFEDTEAIRGITARRALADEEGVELLAAFLGVHPYAEPDEVLPSLFPSETTLQQGRPLATFKHCLVVPELRAAVLVQKRLPHGYSGNDGFLMRLSDGDSTSLPLFAGGRPLGVIAGGKDRHVLLLREEDSALKPIVHLLRLEDDGATWWHQKLRIEPSTRLWLGRDRFYRADGSTLRAVTAAKKVLWTAVLAQAVEDVGERGGRVVVRGATGESALDGKTGELLSSDERSLEPGVGPSPTSGAPVGRAPDAVRAGDFVVEKRDDPLQGSHWCLLHAPVGAADDGRGG